MKKKNIYGTTTNKERNELLEEGIDLVSVPWQKKITKFFSYNNIVH